MLVYVAGPITPKGERTLEENLLQGKNIAFELWHSGFAVISPHANTDLPLTWSDDGDVIDWLKGDFEMIARCDAIVVCPGWEASEGTNQEIKFATQRNIPIYYYPDMPEIHLTERLLPNQVKGYIDIIMNGYRVHLSKNADYSPANIMGTGEIGLVTRTWDKMARLLNLFGFKLEIASMKFEEARQPKCEAIEDTILDLSVYAIIWQLFRKGLWGK